MLQELRINDLAIIDHLELTFGPGFNVLTGETGAGKSIIIDAVNLLLGDRASQEVVRAKAERTEVEATFQLPGTTTARLAPLLAEHGLEGDQPDLLVLSREVRANGRSVARINGRSVTTALLAEVGGQLVEVHGQGEHFALFREREHVRLLDRYAGLAGEAANFADLGRRVRAARRELEGLREDERERARRIDLLAYQVEEIKGAKLKPGEEEELDAERRRLTNAEQLAALSNEVASALSGDAEIGGTDAPGALDSLGQAEQALLKLARIDPDANALAEQLGQAVALVEDLGAEAARYRDAIEFNPRRLEQVEERLHVIRSLQRKYGDTIDEILSYAQNAVVELDRISHSEERIAQLEDDEARLLEEIGRRGATLSASRRAAGERMARAIETELGDLQMARARFGVECTWSPDPNGARVSTEDAASAGEPAGRYSFDSHGLDNLVFLVSANPGEPLRPLAKVASGGETSRLMLALKTVLGRADETPTLIFDEIDQGIGGRVGGMVGRKLWGLTCHDRTTSNGAQSLQHQVLCITHLPQLAAFGDLHFHVAKRIAGNRTVTEVSELAGEARVAELAHMMGAESQAGRASVLEIMAEVALAKDHSK